MGSEATCARCGKQAEGYAYIGEARYCHPDDPNRPDCYTLAQWDLLEPCLTIRWKVPVVSDDTPPSTC